MCSQNKIVFIVNLCSVEEKVFVNSNLYEWPKKNYINILYRNQITIERHKLSFVAKLGNSKILKRLRINPVSWRWNPLTIMPADHMNRSGADATWRI